MENGVLLETERLVLKVLNESDADKVLNYYLRNKNFLSDWEPVRDIEFYTMTFQQSQIVNELNLISEGKIFKVWILEKGDNSLIGSIALNNIVRGAFQSCHLGYKLDQDKINKGYMTEALEKVIEYAFKELQLHRIEANIIPHNFRSLRVVEKLGFYNEGLAIKYLRINGRWEDHIHMVLRNGAME
jgi:[ribosomal protein S5]-alanine N-acetyltransferase